MELPVTGGGGVKNFQKDLSFWNGNFKARLKHALPPEVYNKYIDVIIESLTPAIMSLHQTAHRRGRKVSHLRSRLVKYEDGSYFDQKYQRRYDSFKRTLVALGASTNRHRMARKKHEDTLWDIREIMKKRIYRPEEKLVKIQELLDLNRVDYIDGNP